MMVDKLTFIGLVLSDIISLILFVFIFMKKNKNQLQKIFLTVIVGIVLWCTLLITQIILSALFNIEPIYFDNLVYIFSTTVPIGIFMTGLVFANTKLKITKKYLLLFIIPIISLLVLWTNDYHHLFYEKYSVNISETVTGPYVIVHYIYSYSLLLVGIFYMLYSSIKNSGFFSKQSILIIIGTLIPIAVNVIFTFNLFDLNATIYITPISFALGIIFYSFAIIKFKFLNVVPITLQKIVDRISDSYLILDENNIITDFNKTFTITFNHKEKNLRNLNILKYLEKYNLEVDIENFKKALEIVKKSDETIVFEQKVNQLDKVFSVEINAISQNESFLGILVLFKDITQHKKDLEIIQSNQTMLIERERLASLGQMIGGIAHNLKTPIMSIAGAAEGISELVKEYDLSIDNPQVNSEDHHAIAKEMNEWIEKIKTYTEYMSDVITAVKGQAVNFSEEQVETFTIGELVKHVTILMKHELKNAVVYLNTDIRCNEEIQIKGNINSLVQVINNMISNAIQAYNGEPEKQIDMTIEYKDKNVFISIKDYGPGLPEKVQEKLFKEMITTKGKNGTGLGLYMSYSNIKAHFSGDITVETQKDKGTEFKIKLPV